LRSADLRTLNHVPDCEQHLASYRDTFRAGRLCIRRRADAAQDRIWHRDTQLVLHELRVSCAHQRPYPGEDRNAAMLDAFQESLQDRDIEDRLRNGVLRSGFYLEFEAADLFIEVRGPWVSTHTDNEAGSTSDGVAADIESLI